MNNKEGDLLEFNRSYLQYALHLPISEVWTLSSGVSVGFLNFSATQTVTASSISSFAPDGSIGLWLYRDRELFGWSASQLFNKPIWVVQERIPINRFYRFIYARTIPLSPHIKCTPGFQVAFNSKLIGADLNASLLLKDVVMLGASYRTHRGTSYLFGFKDLTFIKNQLDVLFSYNTPWPNANFTYIQTYELSLSYSIKK